MKLPSTVGETAALAVGPEASGSASLGRAPLDGATALPERSDSRLFSGNVLDLRNRDPSLRD